MSQRAAEDGGRYSLSTSGLRGDKVVAAAYGASGEMERGDHCDAGRWDRS